MSFASRIDAEQRPRADSDRHSRIVEAAQRAFVRLGFHAATMQNVAEEAGMSAGNLYRYFPSKEALVEGLCRQDFDRRAADFMRLASRTDVVEALAMTLMDNVLRAPREKVRLIVEIWAEAGRNPRIAQVSREFDAATADGLRMLLAEAKAMGSAAADMDVQFVAGTVVTMVSGIFKRLAMEDDFDREREASYLVALLRGLLSCAVAPSATPRAETK